MQKTYCDRCGDFICDGAAPFQCEHIRISRKRKHKVHINRRMKAFSSIAAGFDFCKKCRKKFMMEFRSKFGKTLLAESDRLEKEMYKTEETWRNFGFEEINRWMKGGKNG